MIKSIRSIAEFKIDVEETVDKRLMVTKRNKEK
jgi:hypothetical protein